MRTCHVVVSESKDEEVGETTTTGAESAKTSAAATDIKQLTELPFQVQIRYTDRDGAKAMRVLTHMQPVTKERKEADKSTRLRHDTILPIVLITLSGYTYSSAYT